MTDALAGHFWEGCAAGELRFQRCSACGHAQLQARPFCVRCGGSPAWAVSRGLGTVYSLTRVERAPTPEFAPLVPYDILLVDLDEGFRMMAHGEAGLAIGDRVRAEFRQQGGRALPCFRRFGREA